VITARFSLSVLTAIFQVNLGWPVFIEAKDDGVGGDNWTAGAYKSCKAPVRSSPPTNQQPGFFLYRPDALPVTQQTVSKH